MAPPGAIVPDPRGSGAGDLDEGPADRAQLFVHPCVHPAVGAAPLTTRRAGAATSALLGAPVEDHLDLLDVGQRSHQVLVQCLVVPRDDEPESPHAASVWSPSITWPDGRC